MKHPSISWNIWVIGQEDHIWGAIQMDDAWAQRIGAWFDWPSTHIYANDT